MIKLYPCDSGSFVIQSIAIIWKGNVSCLGVIGNRGGLLDLVLALLAWQVAHPLM
jgi:hypothetical protein